MKVAYIGLSLSVILLVPTAEAEESQTEDHEEILESVGGPQTQPRHIQVVTEPVGCDAELVARNQYHRSRPLWHPTPSTFSITTERHVLRARCGGFTSVTMPIEAGSEELLLELDMSRPVFEAGLGLTIIGSTVFLIGTIFAMTDWYITAFMAIPAALTLVPGVLMMALDRQRNTTYELTESTTGRQIGIQSSRQSEREAGRRTRLLLRASMGYIPYPTFHSLSPEVGVGMHWQLERIDVRLIFQGGPTVTAEPGSSFGGQGFIVTGFLSRFGRFYVNAELGAGGGVIERMRVSKYDQDILVHYSFVPAFYSGFDLGYTNGRYSIGPGVRLYLGPGTLREYDWTSIEEDRYSRSRVMPFALSIGLKFEYAWPL